MCKAKESTKNVITGRINSLLNGLLFVLVLSVLHGEGLASSTDYFFGNTNLNWSLANDYCSDHNGSLILLNNMMEWKDYYLSMNASGKCNLFYWTGLRLDSLKCQGDGKWSYNGWAKWDDSKSVEPKSCPSHKCVIVNCDGMRTRQCHLQNKVFCGKDVPTTTQSPHSPVVTSYVGTTTQSPHSAGVTSHVRTTSQCSHSVGVTSDVRTTTQSSQLAGGKTPLPTIFNDVMLTTYSNTPVDGSCNECCFKNNKSRQFNNVNHEQLTSAIRELKSQLAVNKNNLSSKRRKLVSVYDSRRSSVAMGCVAIAILIAFITIIVFLDMVNLVRFFYKCPKEHLL